MNEGEVGVSTVKYPYIIENNNIIEENIADEVIDGEMVDNAFDFNTTWGRGVICSLDRSRMVVFVSAGLFIAFSMHICILSMILLQKYVLFLIISLGIIFGLKAILFLTWTITVISLASNGEGLGF